MSQYPQPYYQQPYGQPAINYSQYGPPAEAELLGPARRAGTLAIVLGVLIALLGTCNGGSALVTSPEQIAEQQAALRGPGMPAPPMSAEAMRNLTVAMGVLTLLVGVGFIVTGVYVRRGSAVAITTGLILSGGLALLMALFVLVMIVAAFASPMFGGVACVLVLPLGISIWLVAWLISAARSNANVATARQQYQAQFYAYQQQQQAYGQAAYGQPAYGAPAAPAPPGYGYGYAPPPPPSFAPPPPGQYQQQQQQPPQPPQSSAPPGTPPAGDADGPPTPPAAG